MLAVPPPPCARRASSLTMPAMPFENRITALARAIINHSLRAEDVPVYDRPLVQECLLVWWLERSIGSRIRDPRPFRTL